MPNTAATIQDARQIETLARRAGEIFAAGGLVVFPTETVYGVGAVASNDRGYERLRVFKGRPDSQPFTVHLAAPDEAEQFADLSTPALRRLVRKVFPGPVTLVVDVDHDVMVRSLKKLKMPPHMAERLFHQNTVGLRCPDDATGRAILAAAGGPVVASSANRRGQAPPLDAQEAAAACEGRVDLIVDGGRCRYGKPSTIVRLRQVRGRPSVSVQREGVYDERTIRKLLRWTVLFVCSGNTCRSPMAEAIARQMLSSERGLAVTELETAGIRVLSAGVHAEPGMPPSSEAVAVVAGRGASLRGHRSRRLTADMVREADVVYCMTEAQRKVVVEMVPWTASKVLVLDPRGDVEDPIGSSVSAYEQCAARIGRAIEQRLQEQQP